VTAYRVEDPGSGTLHVVLIAVVVYLYRDGVANAQR
jgi:hypothetical protein